MIAALVLWVLGAALLWLMIEATHRASRYDRSVAIAKAICWPLLGLVLLGAACADLFLWLLKMGRCE